jgi:hypothetical protein
MTTPAQPAPAPDPRNVVETIKFATPVFTYRTSSLKPEGYVYDEPVQVPTLADAEDAIAGKPFASAERNGVTWYLTDAVGTLHRIDRSW